LSGPEALLPKLVEACLEAGSDARFEADGRSMLPLIRPGDMLCVRRPGDGEPKLGDVVVIRAMPAGGLLLHRVVRKRKGILLIRGDNTTVDNGEFNEADVLAVVSGVERKGRSVWFGSGRWGRLVAWIIRRGWICRVNRVTLFAGRQLRRVLPGEPGEA
jgi:signal peptidase I